MSKKKTSPFTRGYKEVRDRLSKSSKYTCSCFNCVYYYQTKGDTEEVCQNTEVLEYDMVVNGNNIYCLHWKPSSSNSTGQKSMFKRGRSVLD